MSAWTDGLDPSRLATISARHRAMVFTPPPPAAIQDAAATAVVSAAWAREQNQIATEFAETFAPFGLEMQRRNAAEAKAKAAKASAEARARQQADEQDEGRRSRQQSAILALSGDVSESIASIRGEISAILEA